MCYRCAFFEHSILARWIVLLLTGASFAFTIIPLISCEFVLLNSNEPDIGHVQFGIFKGEEVTEEGSCLSWNHYKLQKDFAHHTPSQVTAILACSLLGLTLINLLLVGGRVLGGCAARTLWQTNRIFYILALAFVLATFSYVHSLKDIGCFQGGDMPCEFGTAAIISFANAGVLVFLIPMSWCLPVPESSWWSLCARRDRTANINEHKQQQQREDEKKYSDRPEHPVDDLPQQREVETDYLGEPEYQINPDDMVQRPDVHQQEAVLDSEYSLQREDTSQSSDEHHQANDHRIPENALADDTMNRTDDIDLESAQEELLDRDIVPTSREYLPSSEDDGENFVRSKRDPSIAIDQDRQSMPLRDDPPGEEIHCRSIIRDPFGEELHTQSVISASMNNVDYFLE